MNIFPKIRNESELSILEQMHFRITILIEIKSIEYSIQGLLSCSLIQCFPHCHHLSHLGKY